MARKPWAPTRLFDVFSNVDGSVVARAIGADEAATLLGTTADAMRAEISARSFVDGGDYRAAPHMSISG
jgi:hypothetical protein